MEPHTPKPAVLVHLFYYDTWRHLTTYLNQVPEPYELHVNVAAGEGDAAAIEAVRRYRPDAHIYHTPNLGRDMWPLWRMMAELPTDTPYWAFVHGKKSTHVRHRRSPMYGPNWRKGLLQPIMGSEQAVRGCWAKIDGGAGIVGAKAWTRPTGNFSAYERAAELAGRVGATPAGAHCVYGTMFWASGKLLPHLLALGLTHNDFAPHGDRDGRIEFTLERLIGVIAQHNDLPVTTT